MSISDDLDLFTDTAVGDVRDPYPDYAEARRDRPVDFVVFYAQGSHRVHRYGDIDRMLREPETFSSEVYALDCAPMFPSSYVMSRELRVCVPLNIMCSRKCDTPASFGVSSRAPVRTK